MYAAQFFLPGAVSRVGMDGPSGRIIIRPWHPITPATIGATANQGEKFFAPPDPTPNAKR
jgi:hypothetical protein